MNWMFIAPFLSMAKKTVGSTSCSFISSLAPVELENPMEGAGAPDSYKITKHVRYLKWRNPHLYKLYVRLM